MNTIFFICTLIFLAHASPLQLETECEKSAVKQLVGIRNIKTIIEVETTDVVCGIVEISEVRSNIAKQEESKFIGVLKVRRTPLSRTVIPFNVLPTDTGVFLIAKENNVTIRFGSIKVCEEDTLIIEIPKWNEIHVYSKGNENHHSSNTEKKIEALTQFTGYRNQKIEVDSSCIKDEVQSNKDPLILGINMGNKIFVASTIIHP